MTKANRRINKQRTGSDRPVDVVVGSKRSRAFLATIESNGRDHAGRVIGANGIKWKVA